MKIIDLLNKIANGEEVPNAIKFNDIIYKKADVGEDYYNFTINKWFFKDVFDASGVNLEVEILEEEKKIPEKLDMVLLGQCDNWLQPTIKTDEKIRAELNPYVIDIIRENTLEIQHKFNELLDYLKSKGE